MVQNLVQITAREGLGKQRGAHINRLGDRLTRRWWGDKF
jgi:hypothetical protein